MLSDYLGIVWRLGKISINRINFYSSSAWQKTITKDHERVGIFLNCITALTKKVNLGQDEFKEIYICNIWFLQGIHNGEKEQRTARCFHRLVWMSYCKDIAWSECEFVLFFSFLCVYVYGRGLFSCIFFTQTLLLEVRQYGLSLS